MRKRQAFNYETKIMLMTQIEQTRARKEWEAVQQDKERQEFQADMAHAAEEAQKEQFKNTMAKKNQLVRLLM